MEDQWYNIKREITSTMTSSALRVYVSILDVYGNVKYMDTAIEPYEDIIRRSININIGYIGTGDYCIPLSSKNLMIFKISDKGIVVLFANKGNIAQLLAFRKNVKYFGDQIDSLIGDIEIPAKKIIPPGVKLKAPVEKKGMLKQILGKELPPYYPLINKVIGDKIKATVEEIIILQLCDGQNSFPDIVELTKLPPISVHEFLSKQIKRKVLLFEAHPLLIQCPNCGMNHCLFAHKDEIGKDDEPFKLLIRAEICNHEYVAFINKKLKIETQSFKYFTDFQKDKFMKRLGEHYYIILS